MITGDLIFVYNVNLNPIDLASDFVAEILPQKQTNCQLCSLTYSLVFKKRKWGEFLNNLPLKHTFYFKNQFIKAYPESDIDNFPCILYLKEDKIEVVISEYEMNKIIELDQLINTIEKYIKN